MLLVLALANSTYAATVRLAVVTSSAPPADLSCPAAAPPSVSSSSLTPLTRKVWLYFILDGVQPADSIATQWIDPSGATQAGGSMQGVSHAGTFCYWDEWALSEAAWVSTGDWKIQISANGTVLSTVVFTLKPPGPVKLLTPEFLAKGLVKLPYQVTLSASRGVPPYTWSVWPGDQLPPGLALDSKTGMLSGTPSSTDSIAFGIVVTDRNANYDTRTFFLDINDRPSLEGGAVNAASYGVEGTTSVAQGSLFVVFGGGFALPGLHLSSYPLPADLDGTSVRVTVQGTTVKAPIVYTSPVQVAALLPSAVPTGAGTVILSYKGVDSDPAPIQAAATRFGMFTRNSAGSGPAILQNVNGSNIVLNSHTDTAKPGQAVVLWGTGLGPVTGDEAGGPLPGALRTPVDVLVGNQHAHVLYQGRSGCCAGVDQINFEIPAGIEGCYVPIAVVAGNTISNFGSISISAAGSPCSDAAGLSASDFRQTGANQDFRFGSVELFRVTATGVDPATGQAVSFAEDVGAAGFFGYPPNDFYAAQGVMGVALRGATGLAHFGACNVYPLQGSSESLIPDPVVPDELNASPALNISGPRGTKPLTQQTAGIFTAVLGGQDVLGFAGLNGNGGPLFFDPGMYTVDNGAGTPDTGPFRATISVPAQIGWSNASAAGTIDRSQNFTVRWTGGDASKEFVVVAGLGIDIDNFTGRVFVCTERASAGAFTIPSFVLSSMPGIGASADPTTLNGLLWVGNTSLLSQNKFTAAGLNAGYLYYMMFQFQGVTFR